MEDRAARDFALSLYAGLLGLTATGEGEQPLFQRSAAFRPAMPLPLYAAMRQARIAIAASPSDARTWGAYQHYGNPYFRFFDPVGLGRELKVEEESGERAAAATEQTTEQEAASQGGETNRHQDEVMPAPARKGTKSARSSSNASLLPDDEKKRRSHYHDLLVTSKGNHGFYCNFPK